MADHLSFQDLGIDGSPIMRIGALDNVSPPPGAPLAEVAAKAGPALQPQMSEPHRGWENIVQAAPKPGMPGMGGRS